MERITNKNELALIIGGGFNLTGTIVNAVLSTGKFIFELGKSLGSSLRRIGSNNICKI